MPKFLILAALLLASCSNEDPTRPDTPERFRKGSDFINARIKMLDDTSSCEFLVLVQSRRFDADKIYRARLIVPECP